MFRELNTTEFKLIVNCLVTYLKLERSEEKWARAFI